ncbi:unnamed protein product [Amaranthus hypochondriacus]
MSDYFKDGHHFFGQQQKPTIIIPPKPINDSSSNPFTGAPSPGPPSFTGLFGSDPFQEHEFRSFSDLLAGALATQLPPSGDLKLVNDNWETNHHNNKVETRETGNNGNGSGFKQNRPGNLVLPTSIPAYNISPGFSPSSFLSSPNTFLMSPQQTLAHITALSQAHNLSIQNDTSSLPSSTLISSFQPTMIFNAATPSSRLPTQQPNTTERNKAAAVLQHNNFPAAVDKPADDGYNWRKYGQKQVKGSEYPRSYYRCTSPNCPVKKKVERSYDGHITEIIYKGQHNHDRPTTGRSRGNNRDGSFMGGDNAGFWSGGVSVRDQYDHNSAISMQLNGPSDSEESGEYSQLSDDDDDDNQPKPKRLRKSGAGQSDGGFTHRTVTEPKIVVQTRSDIDLLDDGYRWRKYGQKVVKGNPNPRSYYKCTTVGCNVRKHVERASTDLSAVITTYEGKHNHDVPATRGSNAAINTANIHATAQIKLPDNNNGSGQMSFGTNNQTPITLRLKEEQLVA